MIHHFTIPLNKMKTLILLVTICVAFGGPIMQAAPLSETDRQFLARYEKVRSALGYQPQYPLEDGIGDYMKWLYPEEKS